MDHQGCTSSVKHKRSDFSIARILGTIDRRPETPESCPASPEECEPIEVGNHQEEHQRFEWLQCTRYRPPRLPRSRRREGAQRRKLGRNPRIPFSSAQVGVLEQRFRRSQYLSSSDVAELAAFLVLSETRVKIWFQNRRARERRDRETRQRSPESSPPPEPASLTSLALSHGLLLPEVRQRSLAEAAVALAGISRVHGLNELAVSRAQALARSSAFAPVSPLALLEATSARSSRALATTATRCKLRYSVCYLESFLYTDFTCIT